MAGVVSLPHHPSRSHLEPGFVRRHLGAVIAVLVVVATAAGLIAYGLLTLASSMGNMFNGIDGFVQGGNEASIAAGFATSEGLTYGQLTLTELQARYPRTHWLSANTLSTPSRGSAMNVSTSVGVDHVVIAVAESGGICAWGLAVQSKSDPILASDGLSSPGVYWTVTAPETTTNPPCEASSAPASIWSPLEGTSTGK
jgi:hypothetical protein